MCELNHKPNFICVGAQKAGTTSFYSILKQHPQIFLPNTKEIHYFDKNFDKNTDYYYSFFNDANKKHIAIGEITPNYMYDPLVPERIYKTLGKDIKLIFILRNPADRAFSNYKMNIAKNNEKLSFKDAILNDLKRIEANETYPIVFHYIKRGYYSEQIKRFKQFFSDKKMLFLTFEEDMIMNKKKTFDLIFNFLEVDHLNIPLNVLITPNIKYRSNNLNRIINSSNSINHLAKILVPGKKLRSNVKYMLTKFNQKPTAKKSELDEIKPFLINKIYKKSIMELEELIERDLNYWYK